MSDKKALQNLRAHARIHILYIDTEHYRQTSEIDIDTTNYKSTQWIINKHRATNWPPDALSMIDNQ